MLGYAPEEVLEMKPFDFMPREEAERVADLFGTIIASRKEFKDLENINLHKDGSLVILETSGVPVFDIDGAFRGYRGIDRDITVRKKAERTLRESEEKFRTLFDQAVDSIFFMSSSEEGLIIQDVNKAAQKVHGYSRDEMIGKSIADLDDRETGKHVLARKRILDSGAPLRFEGRHRRKDGSTFPVEVNARLISLEGRPYVLAIDRDITERKRAEERLAESEERYKSIFQNNHTVMLLIDNDRGNIADANPAALAFYGYSYGKIKSMKISDINALSDERVFEEMERARNEQRRHFYVQHRLADGQIRDVEVYSGPIPMLGKSLLLWVVHDITDRKKVETELAQRSQLAVLGADIGIALTQGETLRDMLQRCCDKFVHHLDVAFARIWTLNEADNMLELQASAGIYTHIDGAHSRIPVGMYKIGIIAEKRQPHLSNNIHEDPLISDQEWAKREGMKAFVGYPLIIEDSVIGVIGMFSRNALEDITLKALASVADEVAIGIERIKSEDKLQRVNVELEHKSREMEQLVYVTSHDLRTPLAIVQGYARELEITMNQIGAEIDTDIIPSDMKKRLAPFINDIQNTNKYIRSNMQKMDALLYGLLKLSRSGNISLNLERLDMNRLAADIQESFALMINKAGASVEISELPSCTGDETQINQVFSNLLGNALKYLDPDRPGIIRITGYREGSESLYCVEDNGLGITSAECDRIFNIFYRVSFATAGEGLGLTIVRKILERHSGKIWVESEEGKGSRFYVALPAGNA
jgi:PAS domain S-box-containing protein